jgi:hypothetical protein
MESHDKVPRPSERMRFGNNLIPPTQGTDNTISFGDTADTPIFFDQPMQDFSDNQSVAMVNEGGMASHQPLQPSQDSAVLPSVSVDGGISLQGRGQELWPSQCHNKSSTVGTRCTTWCHKLPMSMTTSNYMT